MEKENYTLRISEEMDNNLFQNPVIALKGTDRGRIVKKIVENNREYASVILDRDGLLSPIDGAEYVGGERKAVAGLRKFSDGEIERRMEKLADSNSRNFFEYNLTHTGDDEMKPTLLFFMSRKLSATVSKLLWKLSVYAKALGLFVFYCEHEDEKVYINLLAATYLDITANENEAYVTEYFVSRDTPITL